MMTKLHEVLAVESNTQRQANKIIMETTKNLRKDHLYKGVTRTLKALREEDAYTNTTETTMLESTVDEMLSYAEGVIADSMALTLQKEQGNTIAKADLVVDGKTLMNDVPATFLLYLENRLALLRDSYDNISTLETGIRWIPDATAAKEGVYVTAEPVKSLKQKTQKQYQVVVPATPEHPAQVKEASISVDVGVYETSQYSGQYSPAAKAKLLGKVDKLISAVRKARMRANDVVVSPADKTAVKKLFEYLHE